MTEAQIILVTGGIRSGKSAFAEGLAAALGDHVAYLATGQASDAEMAERITAHRHRRPEAWKTVESTQGLAMALAPVLESVDAVLLDDVGSMVSDAVLRELSRERADEWLMHEEDALWSAVSNARVPFIAVTSEVGLSLVPTSALGRRFVDLLGDANQRWAARAKAVHLVVAGLSVRLK